MAARWEGDLHRPAAAWPWFVLVYPEPGRASSLIVISLSSRLASATTAQLVAFLCLPLFGVAPHQRPSISRDNESSFRHRERVLY